MFKTNYHKPGTAPATLVAPKRVTQTRPVITLIEYDQHEIIESKIQKFEDLLHCRTNDKVSWINIDGLGDVDLLRKLGQHFGLHSLALEDVLNTSQRPKIEEYGDHFFIVAQMVYEEKGEISSEQVSIFLGKKFLITIQEEGDRDLFEPVRNRLRNGGGFARGKKHDYLAYALIDALTDHFFPILESIGEEIENLENELLENPTKQSMAKLHKLKRTLLQLRRAAWPEREVISGLTRDETGMITNETKIFLRDCYDHTIQIMDVIENYRDLMAGLMDIYLSGIGIRTNEVMRVLTVITSIFIPLTFIVGIYGMNFDPAAGPYSMPELKHPYGYVICLAFMFCLALGMLILFRKKRWI